MAVDYLSTINQGGSGLNITQLVDSLVEAEKAPQENIIQNKIDNSGQVNMFPVHEYWSDIGHINQFEKAQEDYGNF